MKRLELTFTKMQGTGNNFIFVDLRSPKNKDLWMKAFGRLSRKRIARQLCNPFFGVGADGFAIFEKTNIGAAVKWDFYNADGSKAKMCGNAARCAGLYLTKGKILKKPFKLRTGAGVVEIMLHSIDRIEVQMTKTRSLKLNQKLIIKGSKIKYDFIDTGVPHVVIAVNNLKLNDKYRELALQIQRHSRFLPQSTNVTFYEKLNAQQISTASFERGVFDFTKACGTGAVAAAISFAKKSPSRLKKLKLRVPGGQLEVYLENQRPHLVGPARRISDFKIYI